MCVAKRVDMRAIYKIRFAIDAHGEVATFPFQLKFALAAGDLGGLYRLGRIAFAGNGYGFLRYGRRTKNA